VYWLHGFEPTLFGAFIINVEISTNRYTCTSRKIRTHPTITMDGPTAHRWAGLNPVKELFLAPTSWQKLKRRWDKSKPTYWLLSPVRRATPTRDIVPWSFKLATMYTFESPDERCTSLWHKREVSPSLHWSVSYPWEAWISRVLSGATIKIVRCAQCIPCVPTWPTSVIRSRY
jgi:hypothetical protein